MRIALAHLAPVAGDLEHNRRLIEAAVRRAADLGADWILTPELCVSGYEFAPAIGTDWIVPQPDDWMSKFCGVVAQLGVTVFLGCAEKDASTGLLHNAAFAIGPDGAILGSHRKRRVIPGIEGWASPGGEASPIPIPTPSLNVGVLICADAYRSDTASELKQKGADVLVSSAAWTPAPHGPETAWEDRSRETGLPLFVCNRTGVDRRMSFVAAESVVAVDGERVVVFGSPDSAVLLVDYDIAARKVLGIPQRIDVSGL